MADEITINAQLEVRNGSLVLSERITGLRVAIGGLLTDGGSFAVTASAAAIPFAASVTPVGWAWLANITGGESPPDILIGPNDGAGARVPMIRLRAGEAHPIRLDTNDLITQTPSGTATLKVLFLQGDVA